MGQRSFTLTKPSSLPVTYTSYLKVDELLKTQQPLAQPSAPDELLFIITHQSYELWFKLIINDLDRTLVLISQDNFIPAFHLLERVCLVIKNLTQQLDVLETMTPVAFNLFRSQLHPASGFQSWQFRELELLAGGEPQDYSRFADLEPEWFNRVQERGAKPNLRTVFTEVLKRRNLIGADTSSPSIEKAVLRIYQNTVQDELQTLCEFLIQLDEQIMLWRFRHVQMVERMIGMKMGTGGSLGVKYLESTLKKKFFPELWASRTQMGNGY